MNSKNWLIVAILLSLLGCAQTPNRNEDKVVIEETIVSAPSNNLVEEIQQSINAQEFRNADLLLQQLKATSGSPEKKLQYNLLALEYAIALEDTDMAQFFINQIDPEQLNQSDIEQQLQHGLLTAQFYELNEQFLTASQERDYLSGILEGDTYSINHQQLWQNLTNISLTELTQASAATTNLQFSKWLQLASIAKDPTYTLEEHIAAIQKWQLDNPFHPAAIDLPGDLKLLAQSAKQQPKHIALLLPLTGKFSNSGKAVREGFMAAYYQTLHKGFDVPSINIIDTEASGSIELAYGDAQALGAEWIIGPLDKKQVNELSSSTQLPIPTLALNYSDDIDMGGLPTNLYQFGLSAEDEAMLIADRAFLLGYRHVLALTPNNSWGKRVYASFEAYWLSLGGHISEQLYYESKKDYNPDIKSLLNVNESQSRYKKIRQIMREPVEFETYRREDADWVFLLALPTQGRQIKPMFNFNFAASLPVFSTSHIFTGTVNNQKDMDLNGIQFTDIPWLLEDSELKKTIEKNQELSRGSYSRLYALGVDAFRLYPRLQQLSSLKSSKIFGVTGDLSLDENNRIHRKLPFSIFKNGKPAKINIESE
mgnify:CR=1 FL=1